jgi:hypothetical protein
MKLTSEQEDIVYNTVKDAGVQLESLQADIVDHLCCVIESQLGKGRPFDQLLKEAIHDLAPNGLNEIQNQTLFLLNAKRIIIMKKLIYSTGFIGALTLTAGVTFKLLWWPMANNLFLIGFTLLLLVFFPLLGFDRYKVAISHSMTERLKIIIGVISALTIGIAGIFKYFHLQGAMVLFGLGALIFAFGFLPFLFFTMYKKSVS